MSLDPDLLAAVSAAITRRAGLLAALHAEETSCYRLFHGVAEGAPGVTIDRYGPGLLVQTFREPPMTRTAVEALAAAVNRQLGLELALTWNHRGEGRAGFDTHFPQAAPAAAVWGQELGLWMDVRLRHRGLDPLLFVDLRVGRRWLKAHAKGASVLNLFAYTGSAGLMAQAGGAKEVWNVDFARGALQTGLDNEARNGLSGQTFFQEDALAILRQVAGLRVGGRGPQAKRFHRVPARSFDIVVLDPPTWATSPFGAVDIVGDYPSLFKPAVLATRPGGVILATHHSAATPWATWASTLERCAAKAGRPLRAIERLLPEADVPSFDGDPPLKIAVCRA